MLEKAKSWTGRLSIILLFLLLTFCSVWFLHFFPPTNVYGVNAKQGADLGALQERHANVSDLDLTLRMLQRQTHLQIEHLTRC